jgi:mannosyltransferase OCH1-like enzyme
MKKMLISTNSTTSFPTPFIQNKPLISPIRPMVRNKPIEQKRFAPEVFYDENIIIELEKLKLTILEEISKLDKDLIDLEAMPMKETAIVQRVKEKIELDTKILNNNIIDINKKIQAQTEINNRLKEEYERKSQAEKDRLELLRRVEEQKREEEEKMREKQRILQEKKDNAVIPFKIFQTWHSINLTKGMKDSINKIKKNNPEFEYIFHDDNQCREFIANHFPDMVLYAFDNLIPGAYKADIWRYCILYIYGGIYIDIKFEPIGNYKLLDLVDDEYYVLDRPNQFGVSLYNGLMVMKPKNEILKIALNQIIKNVTTKNYNSSSFHITGSALLGNLLHENETYDEVCNNYKLKFSKCGNYIVTIEDGENIFKVYQNYRDEQKKNSKIQHHEVLWNARKIYVVKNMNMCIFMNSIDI